MKKDKKGSWEEGKGRTVSAESKRGAGLGRVVESIARNHDP